MSVVGNQRFTFTSSLELAHGTSVVVTSGPSARTGTRLPEVDGRLHLAQRRRPGQLLDPSGAIRAEAP